MFEKEAEDNKPPYAFCALDTKCELWKDGFQKGAEYGYNKANEWHFVKDGLPISDKDKYYFVVDKWNEPMIARFYCGKWSNHLVIDDVIAWQEIVLPELKETK